MPTPGPAAPDAPSPGTKTNSQDAAAPVRDAPEPH
jgi:hypothetical protein